MEELSEIIPPWEMDDWRVFDRFHPIGSKGDDYRIASLARWFFLWLHPNTKPEDVPTLETFILKWEESTKTETKSPSPSIDIEKLVKLMGARDER